MKSAVVLIAHGTVESLDDLPAFLANIRRGHAAPADLVAEVRRRYEAIGGRSPLLDTSRALAAKVESVLSVPVRVAMRLWSPHPRDVIADLLENKVERVAVVPLAQHSAKVYADAMREAAAGRVKLACAENWGRQSTLVDAYVTALREAIDPFPAHERAKTWVLFSAHSLPVAVVRAGDPYEEEVRASAALIALRALEGKISHDVVFQSQGMSTGPGGKPMEWLGPNLHGALVHAKKQGAERVVVAPIGFLADHVEILYDLDIEARAWADELGLAFSRTRSLNDSDALADAVSDVARPLLAALEAT